MVFNDLIFLLRCIASLNSKIILFSKKKNLIQYILVLELNATYLTGVCFLVKLKKPKKFIFFYSTKKHPINNNKYSYSKIVINTIKMNLSFIYSI